MLHRTQRGRTQPLNMFSELPNSLKLSVKLRRIDQFGLDCWRWASWPRAGAAMRTWRLLRRLIKRRAAGVAQARPLPAQAGGDRARIRDFAGAEAIDIGGAGAALLGSALILRKGCT